MAKRLADALKNQHWSVWWDPKLRAGEHFDDAIERALKEAKCVIVMWSKLSVNSDYVKAEASYARKRNKLVPIAIEKVDLPFPFEGIHTEQLIDWDGSESFPGYQKLISDIESILGPPPFEFEERERKEEAEGEVGKDSRKEDSEVKRTIKKELKHNAEVERENKETKAKIVEKESPTTSPKSSRQKRIALGIVSLFLVALLIGILIYFYGTTQSVDKEAIEKLSKFRVSLQYNSEKNEKLVNQLANIIRNKGYYISNVWVNKNPTKGDVRYFYPSDKSAGRDIENIVEEFLKSKGIALDIAILYLKQYEGKAESGAIEIWLPKITENN
jgi:hypothetical protein